MQPYTGTIYERKFFRKCPDVINMINDVVLDSREDCSSYVEGCGKVYISMMDANLDHPNYPKWGGKWYYLEDTDPFFITAEEVRLGIHPHHYNNLPGAPTMYTRGIFVSADETKWRFFGLGEYCRLPKDGAIERTLPSFVTPPVFNDHLHQLQKGMPGYEYLYHRDQIYP
jgi:hypothetical protein